MIFETHLDTPEDLSSSLLPAYSNWKAQNPHEAFQSVRAFLKTEEGKTTSNAKDWLFALQLASSCGMYELAERIDRLAVRNQPSDPWIRIHSIWTSASESRLNEACQAIAASREELDSEYHPFLDALSVLAYSTAGWRMSASEMSEKARATADSAIPMYILARAAGIRSEWRESSELCEQAVQLAPRCLRMRSILVDSLMGQGNIEKAKHYLNTVPVDSPPSMAFDVSVAFFHEGMGDSAKSIDALKETLDKWPNRSRLQRFLARHTSIRLAMMRRSQEANELLSKYRVRNVSWVCDTDAKRQYIVLPLISQGFKQCVPTVAAMVAESQNVAANAFEFAEKMSTKDGTELWRMEDHMRSLGFRIAHVKPEPHIIESVLDQGVPLIASLKGVTSAHVEVLNGYDKQFQMISIRDPMHWYGSWIRYDSLTSRYADSGGLIVLIAPSRNDVTLEEDWIDTVSQSCIALARACAKADRVQAEIAFAEIPDDSPLSLSRDSYGRGIVITPQEFERRLAARMPLDKDDFDVQDVRVLLNQIDHLNASRIREFVNQKRDKYGNELVHYIHGLCFIAESRWQEAQALFCELLKTLPQMEELWTSYAQVLEQLGKSREAQAALRNAIDINPECPSLRQRLILLQESTLSYNEVREQVMNAAKSRIDRPDYYPSILSLIEEGKNGLELENCLRNCIRYYPRNPVYWTKLIYWFLYQGRLDLARKEVTRARELLSVEDIPRYDWEEETSHENSDKKSDEEASQFVQEKPISVSQDKVASPNDNVEFVIDRLESKSKDLASDALCRCQEVFDLVTWEQNEKMRWWQSVRFRSLLINKILHEIETQKLLETVNLALLQNWLPSKIAMGIPERYAMLLLESLSRHGYSREVARVLRQWLLTRCPDYKRHPALFFEVAYLEEQMGLSIQAQGTLDEILKEHPAYASAWYRKSQLELARNNPKAAWNCLIKAVELSPGLFGGWTQLADLAAYTGSHEEIGLRKTICEMHPYSRSRLYEAFSAIDRHSPSQAKEYLDSCSDRFCKDDRLAIEARVRLDGNEVIRAKSLIDQIDSSQIHFNQYEWLRVDLAIGESNFEAALKHLENMIDRTPNDQDLIEQKVRLLRQINPEQARIFSEEQIKKGCTHPIVALTAIETLSSPLAGICRFVDECTSERRDAMIMSFSDALSRPKDVHLYVAFLEWCNENHKHLVDLRESLAIRLSMRGRSDVACKIADELLATDSENPRWLRLKGVTKQDSSPRESIVYLRQDFEKTGNIDSLSRIARAHQLLNEHEQAKETYLEVLSINPRETMAITNLHYRYAMSTIPLFQSVCDALNHGLGVDDQYFHVVAVKMALKLKKRLPSTWYASARKRWEIVEREGGFQDEAARLKSAMIAWESATNLPHELQVFPSPSVARIKAKWIWPGFRWVTKS